MNQPTKRRALGRMTVRTIAAVTLSGGLAACATVEPFDYTAIHEIPSGPGLLSGEDGEFELYKRE